MEAEMEQERRDMIILALACVLSVLIFIHEWRQAPEGYEDDTGFHFAQTPSPRPPVADTEG
jgi:hypothetical protein